jgi:hypothetical protein
VTDADQLRVTGKHLELAARVLGLQIDPADDTLYPSILLSQGDQKIRFLFGLPGLKGDKSFKTILLHQSPQLFWKELTMRLLDLLIDPDAARGVGPPEMPMRANPFHNKLVFGEAW